MKNSNDTIGNRTRNLNSKCTERKFIAMSTLPYVVKLIHNS